MEFVSEHANILWFCDNCIDKLNQMKQYPINTTQDVVTAVSDAFRVSLDELKVELRETKELTKSLIEKRQTNESSAPRQPRTAWPSLKRTRDIAEKGTPKSHPELKLVGGTKSVEKGCLTVETVEKPPEKFWLYLSRIARHVTEDDVSELVKCCLQTQNPIDVRKLVRKDADLNQFAFISFKVGVDKDLKQMALDPSIWPKGVFFREFKDIQTGRDFWGPTKMPRIEVGIPSTPLVIPSTPIDVTPVL